MQTPNQKLLLRWKWCRSLFIIISNITEGQCRQPARYTSKTKITRILTPRRNFNVLSALTNSNKTNRFFYSANMFCAMIVRKALWTSWQPNSKMTQWHIDVKGAIRRRSLTVNWLRVWLDQRWRSQRKSKNQGRARRLKRSRRHNPHHHPKTLFSVWTARPTASASMHILPVCIKITTSNPSLRLFQFSSKTLSS